MDNFIPRIAPLPAKEPSLLRMALLIRITFAPGILMHELIFFSASIAHYLALSGGK
jgi:hypothetical protein